jgi:Ca2+-binding EF-hand superfamily protein
MTNRQRAEIQLESILNDPEASLPAFERRASDKFTDDKISIVDVSKLLNTQPFIIERLINALFPSDTNEQPTEVTKIQVQKLTRVLNSTMDVRALLFFMILDASGNWYITDDGLAKFYEKYLKNLKSFDNTRSQEIIQVLLQKFHFDQKSQIDFEEFYSIVSKDSTLLESLSYFTINPTWFIQPSSSPDKNQNTLQKFFSNLCWQQTIYEQQKNKLTIDYIKDNLSRIIVFTVYILVNLALCLYVIIYRAAVTKANVLVVFARIGGMLLNFNCAFIIVLMLKQTILLIRSNVLIRKLIPVDDHIDFHKVVGRVIAGLAILHTIAHMANFGRMTGRDLSVFVY